MLFRPEDFEPVTDERWDESRVRAAIARIVADVDEAYRRHPSGRLRPTLRSRPAAPSRPSMPARPVSSGRSTRCSCAGMRSPGSTLRRSRSRRSRRGARARSSSPAWTSHSGTRHCSRERPGVLLVAWSLTERP